jgi:hypothetical protein
MEVEAKPRKIDSTVSDDCALSPRADEDPAPRLPDGCTVHRLGLVLRPGLNQQEWLGIGRQLSDLAGAMMWMLGDFFAYGDHLYTDKNGAKRMPAGIYAEIAAQTGYDEQTLRSMKYVAAAIPLWRRRNSLTFSHAREIVGRTEPDQHDFWIAKVETERMSSKSLREQIRKAKALYQPEPNDTAANSFLETARQFDRDFRAWAGSPKFTPKYRAEVAKILVHTLNTLRDGKR